MKIFLAILSLFFQYCCIGQCTIKNTFISSEGKEMRSEIYDGLCVFYKTKGKHKLLVYVDGAIQDTYLIIDVCKTKEYISMIVFHEGKDDLLVRFRFYLNETKKESIISSDYKLVEIGTGLSYKISKKIRGTGKQYPEKYGMPPDW